MAHLGSTDSARSADGLELAIAVRGTVLRVSLANRGDHALGVYFAAEALGRRHHDFLTVQLVGLVDPSASSAGSPGARSAPDGRASERASHNFGPGLRVLCFTGDRNASTTGYVDVAPGAVIADELDLASWANEPINGETPLAAGDHELTATYEVDQQGAWSGSLTAGPVKLAGA